MLRNYQFYVSERLAKAGYKTCLTCNKRLYDHDCIIIENDFFCKHCIRNDSIKITFNDAKRLYSLSDRECRLAIDKLLKDNNKHECVSRFDSMYHLRYDRTAVEKVINDLTEKHGYNSKMKRAYMRQKEISDKVKNIKNIITNRKINLKETAQVLTQKLDINLLASDYTKIDEMATIFSEYTDIDVFKASLLIYESIEQSVKNRERMIDRRNYLHSKIEELYGKDMIELSKQCHAYNKYIIDFLFNIDECMEEIHNYNEITLMQSKLENEKKEREMWLDKYILTNVSPEHFIDIKNNMKCRNYLLYGTSDHDDFMKDLNVIISYHSETFKRQKKLDESIKNIPNHEEFYENIKNGYLYRKYIETGLFYNDNILEKYNRDVLNDDLIQMINELPEDERFEIVLDRYKTYIETAYNLYTRRRELYAKLPKYMHGLNLIGKTKIFNRYINNGLGENEKLDDIVEILMIKVLKQRIKFKSSKYDRTLLDVEFIYNHPKYNDFINGKVHICDFEVMLKEHQKNILKRRDELESERLIAELERDLLDFNQNADSN